jgi:dipeptide/tripeptide permease
MITKKKVFSLIICNEVCERFCFYELRSLLFMYIRNEFGQSHKIALRIVHCFVALNYFCTIFGGAISDSYVGRYQSIMILSLIYLLGTLMLVFSSIPTNNMCILLLSLFLIAVGSGGLKPCIAAFGGDQFEDEVAIHSFFKYFYYAIYIGSTMSNIWSPLLADINCLGRASCYPLSFSVSSFLLACSIGLLFLGSENFIFKDPTSYFYKNIVVYFKQTYLKSSLNSQKAIKIDEISSTDFSNEHSRAAKDAEQNISLDEHKLNDLEPKKTIEPKDDAPALPIPNLDYEKTVADIKKVKGVIKLFLPITFFWMLFDQQISNWIEQGLRMKSSIFTEMKLIPVEMSIINSLFMILFIPSLTYGIYPLLKKLNVSIHPLDKMVVGMFLGAFSFFIASLVEYYIHRSPEEISILWQTPQYIFMTLAEMILNMNGLEFVYNETPESMKGIVLSCWLLTVSFGNIMIVFFSYFDIGKLFFEKKAHMLNYIIYGGLGIYAALNLKKRVDVYKKQKEELSSVNV